MVAILDKNRMRRKILRRCLVFIYPPLTSGGAMLRLSVVVSGVFGGAKVLFLVTMIRFLSFCISGYRCMNASMR